jgi:ATP synthase protein I
MRELGYNPNGIIKRRKQTGPKMKQKPPPSVWGSLALVGELGFTIAIPIALLAILGSFLDGKFHTGPWLLLLGLLLGLISGVYGAYRLLTRERLL